MVVKLASLPNESVRCEKGTAMSGSCTGTSMRCDAICDATVQMTLLLFILMISVALRHLRLCDVIY
jgi:hypothetical protein